MKRLSMMTLVCLLVFGRAEAQDKNQIPPLTPEEVKAIEAAAPNQAPAVPAKARKVLVYGRVETHGRPVLLCFQAMEILGRKSGAFTTVASGDPAVFEPDSLQQFDAIVMNNSHGMNPWYRNTGLGPAEQKAANARAPALRKGFLDFVAGGKGLVGIHAAIIGDLAECFDEAQLTHCFRLPVWIKPEEPTHPLCAPLGGQSFQLIGEETYILREPHLRQTSRVLLGLDVAKMKDRMPDEKSRPDKDYAISWVRPYGKGRVFYCALGHFPAPYANPIVMRHYLAGIQFAIGDLKADAGPKDSK